MSYQRKLEEARELLVQHNSNIFGGKLINIEDFFVKLAMAGGTSDAALSHSSWEDLQEFGLPKLLARQVATIFRSKEEKAALKKSQVEGMGIQELLANYDPRNHTGLVNRRLLEIFGKKSFIVFNNDGSVNVPVSQKLAQEILDDFPQRELYTVNDVPLKTYPVGVRPDHSFDENPLYPGRILRPDGDCDQTNRSWNDVSLEVRQVLYLATKQTKEVVINSINDAHNIMDLVVGKEDVEALRVVRRRFSKAAALLMELYQQGKAPSLKIFKRISEESKPNNPFGTNRTY